TIRKPSVAKRRAVLSPIPGPAPMPKNSPAMNAAPLRAVGPFSRTVQQRTTSRRAPLFNTIRSVSLFILAFTERRQWPPSSGNTFLATFQYATDRSLYRLLCNGTQKEKTMCATGRHARSNEAITMTTISSLELRSKITSEGRLELWLEKVTVRKPAADEVVVRIDAAPLNPSDIILLLGPAEPASIQAGGT